MGLFVFTPSQTYMHKKGRLIGHPLYFAILYYSIIKRLLTIVLSKVN